MNRPPVCSPPVAIVAPAARGVVEHAQGALQLRLGDQRAEVRVLGAGSDLHGIEGGDHARDRLLVDRPLDQQAAAGGAALARVLEQRLDDRGDRLVEVGVGEHDVRRLAAELEVERGEPLRAGGGDLRAGRGRADERDVVDARVLDERRAGLAVAGGDLDHPARDAGALGELGEPQRRDRGQLRRLEDHGVAGRERRRGAARGDLQRVVPRDDLAADAPRLAERVVERVRAERDRAALEPLDRAGVVLEVADGRGGVGLGLRERLAGVARLEVGERVGLVVDELREPRAACASGRAACASRARRRARGARPRPSRRPAPALVSGSSANSWPVEGSMAMKLLTGPVPRRR